MDSVLTLIGVQKDQNSLGEYVKSSETKQEVLGTVESVTRAEWYQAGREGKNPEIVFTTPIVNYSGEQEAELNGIRYSIYRTYMANESDEIELYLERKAGVQ